MPFGSKKKKAVQAVPATHAAAVSEADQKSAEQFAHLRNTASSTLHFKLSALKLVGKSPPPPRRFPPPFHSYPNLVTLNHSRGPLRRATGGWGVLLAGYGLLTQQHTPHPFPPTIHLDVTAKNRSFHRRNRCDDWQAR